MELNQKERLQLSLSLKILQKLSPQEEDYYANLVTIVEDGLENHYYELVSHISEEVISSEESNMIYDILDMHRNLYDSFQKIENPTISIRDITFRGFDGNNESKLMSYVSYLLANGDRYSEIKEMTGGQYNSHSQRLYYYRRMLDIFSRYPTEDRSNLSEDQIKEILEG